jgi:hypothetical protein
MILRASDLRLHVIVGDGPARLDRPTGQLPAVQATGGGGLTFDVRAEAHRAVAAGERLVVADAASAGRMNPAGWGLLRQVGENVDHVFECFHRLRVGGLVGECGEVRSDKVCRERVGGLVVCGRSPGWSLPA